MKRFTKKQKAYLDKAWEDVKVAEDKYYTAINLIEEKARLILDIDIEVFHCDGSAVGFGDYGREYKLYEKDRS